MLEVFVSGPLKTQPAVQLLLRHAGVNRPDLDAPLDLGTKGSDFNRRRVAQKRRRARVALDHHHAMALFPGPLVDFRRGVPGIHRELCNRHFESACACESFIQQPGELVPHLRARGVAFEHAIIDGPRFLPASPRYDLDLDAVLLNVRARR